MSKALGDQLYINPYNRDGDYWTGKIKSIGAKGVKYTTYNICDIVVYHNNHILGTSDFEGFRVHIVNFQNIRKIEGVY